jgi:hypothetical protein
LFVYSLTQLEDETLVALLKTSVGAKNKKNKKKKGGKKEGEGADAADSPSPDKADE